MRSYARSKGFTLVELMVVVAIIGVLAAIAVPSYQKYMLKSKISVMVKKLDALKKDSEEYMATRSACQPGTGGAWVDAAEYLNSPASSPVRRIGIITGWHNPGECAVGVMANPAVFGTAGEFDLVYSATAINPPVGSLAAAQNTVIWQCYYYIDTASTLAKLGITGGASSGVGSLIPDNCLPW